MKKDGRIVCMHILVFGRKYVAKSENIISALKNLGMKVDFLLFPIFNTADTEGSSVISSDGKNAIVIQNTRISMKLFSYLYHLFKSLFLFWKYFRGNRYDVFFAIDWFEGLILIMCRTLFARNTKVIFYSYDYYFAVGSFFNRYIIHWINNWVTKHADEVWVVNDSIRMAREKDGAYARVNRIVPLGIEDKLLSYDICNNRHFLFVGSFKSGHNLLKMVDVFTELVKCDARFELTIVGGGLLQKSLKQKIQENDAESYIHMRGFLSEKEIESEIVSGKFAGGIALYEDTPVIATVDPGKIKDYFSWYLPVLTTSYNPISEDIRMHDLGYVIEKDDVTTMVNLFKDIHLNELRVKKHNISQYIGRHSFEEILRKNLFEKIS